MADQPSFWNDRPSSRPKKKRGPQETRAPSKKISPFDRAFKQAMQRLNRRALSSSQIAAKLRLLKHEDETIEQVIDRLTSIGALDDEKLAKQIVGEVVRQGPAGPMLMRKKLARFGFDRAIVDRVVAKAAAESSPVEAARRLVERRLPAMARLPEEKRLRRLFGLLARRGLDRDTIETVLRDLP
jgi:regulatory protein